MRRSARSGRGCSPSTFAAVSTRRATETRWTGNSAGFEALTALGDELRQTGRLSVVGRLLSQPAPPPPRTARAEALAAANAASLHARELDFTVLVAMRQAIEALPVGELGSVRAAHLAWVVVEWQRFERSNKWAIRALPAKVRTVPDESEDEPTTEPREALSHTFRIATRPQLQSSGVGTARSWACRRPARRAGAGARGLCLCRPPERR